MKTKSSVPAALAIVIFFATIPEARVPSGNLVLSVSNGSGTEFFDGGRLSIAVARDLREKGYAGKLRETPEIAIIADGESLIRLTVLKSCWETKKAFSIPYLLNRYKKAYLISVFVEIPQAKNQAYSRTITAGASSKVEAQFIQNDRYDPDLLLDQTQRINLEEEACKKLARILTGLISRNLE